MLHGQVHKKANIKLGQTKSFGLTRKLTLTFQQPSAVALVQAWSVCSGQVQVMQDK